MSWQAAIPLTIAFAGFFHYLLAVEVMSSNNDIDFTLIGYSWLGFAFLLVVDSVFAVHLFATNPATPTSLATATRVAYMLVMGSFFWSLFYFIVKGIKYTVKEGLTSGKRWFR